MAANIERAKIVRSQRLLRGWIQEQLAEVANLSIRTIQRLEKDGTANPETLMAVAQEFKMTVEQLSPSATPGANTSIQKRIHMLPRIVEGTELTYLVSGIDHLQFEHDEDSDPRSVSAMKDVLQEFSRDVVRLHDADSVERPKIEEELSKEFKGIEGLGYFIFGIRQVVAKVEGDKQSLASLATFYMSHSRSPRVVTSGKLMVVPALLTELLQS